MKIHKKPNIMYKIREAVISTVEPNSYMIYSISSSFRIYSISSAFRIYSISSAFIEYIQYHPHL